MNKLLIAVPTYNEKENVEKLYFELKAQNINADIFFVDDNSPDGTGQILDDMVKKDNRLFLMHRSGKLGIGSAHFDIIKWAYKKEYDILITMDCDFTHNPSYISKLIEASVENDLVVSSRFALKNSLPNWNLYRKAMTILGHLLTRYLLGLKYDSTGAFRLYKLKNIDLRIFELVQSKGYSFFFESLFILNLNQRKIIEIPIILPARTYGSSKMRSRDVIKSFWFMFTLFIKRIFNKSQFVINK